MNTPTVREEALRAYCNIILRGAKALHEFLSALEALSSEEREYAMTHYEEIVVQMGMLLDQQDNMLRVMLQRPEEIVAGYVAAEGRQSGETLQ